MLPSLVEDVPGATQHALAERLRLLSFEDLSVRDLSMEEAQEWQFGFYVPPPPPPPAWAGWPSCRCSTFSTMARAPTVERKRRRSLAGKVVDYPLDVA